MWRLQSGALPGMGTPGGAEGRWGGEEVERAPVVVGDADEEEVKSMPGACVVSRSSGGDSTMQNINGDFGVARGLLQKWWTGKVTGGGCGYTRNLGCNAVVFAHI